MEPEPILEITVTVNQGNHAHRYTVDVVKPGQYHQVNWMDDPEKVALRVRGALI